MTGLFGTAEKMKTVLTVNYTTDFEHWKPSLLFQVEAKLENPVHYTRYSKTLPNFLSNISHANQSFSISTYSKPFYPCLPALQLHSVICPFPLF